MDYIEYNFKVEPKEPFSEILMAFLSDNEFETFVETEEGFLGYIPMSDEEQNLQTLINSEALSSAQISYTTSKVEDRNWNAKWEEDFQPITVDDEVYIKADFHPEQQFPYVIRIQPKMSFGTGHHETTFLMIQMMKEMSFKDKDVLDMGAGTAILAIYAKMKGANYVEAIDIDEWAYENALENVKRNSTEITVKQGDASLLNETNFDVVLANINKNILLHDISKYVSVLNKKGSLVLSGILESDFSDINSVCKTNGLIFEERKQKNEWISVRYTKN